MLFSPFPFSFSGHLIFRPDGRALAGGQIRPAAVVEQKIVAVEHITVRAHFPAGADHIRQIVAGLPLGHRRVVVAAVAVADAVGPQPEVEGYPLGPLQRGPLLCDVLEAEPGLPPEVV